MKVKLDGRPFCDTGRSIAVCGNSIKARDVYFVRGFTPCFEFFIIAVFFGLGFYIATSVGIKTIQENWPQYRCNPLYMPFASTLAPVPTTSRENFVFCLGDFMKSAAPALTQPLSYVQSMTLALTGSMVQSQEKTQEKKAEHSFNVGQLFEGLFSMIGGILAEFQILFIM